ncbi:MAG: hypothetical protein WC376_02225 [Candidatus Nanoarchaeia archaeon]|jgi:hypothetical protein
MIPILLSTACYHNKYDNINGAVLRAIKPSHIIDGLEISLLSKSECMEFKVSEELINYSAKKIISMHAASKGVVYRECTESNDILGKIKKDYDSLGVINVTFHKENIESIEYLIKQMKGYNFSIENTYILKTEKDYFKGLKKCLDLGIGLTLDVEHARNELMRFLHPDIKKSIAEIHYSSYNPCFNHDCYSSVFERFEEIIKVIKIINKPVVIEIDLRNEEELFKEHISSSGFVISKEIALLRSRLE